MTHLVANPFAHVPARRDRMRGRSQLAHVGTAILGWCAVGLWSLYLPVLLLLLAMLAFAREAVFADLRRRVHLSLLLGTACAWVLLPHTVLDFAAQRMPGIATEIPGCQVMAYAGFPIRHVSANGHGGWRLFHHLLGDRATHAANCLLLAAVWWGVLGLVPRRFWVPVHVVAWIALLPLCGYGLAQMLPWWD